MKKSLISAVVFASAMSGLLYAQARSAPDWTTQGFDAQRSSWMRVDPYISIDNMSKFQFIWKLKVDNESRHGNALTTPVALGNLMTFRGFKSLIFVGGSSNNVYGIDYDFGTMFWRTHHNYTAGAREYAGSPTCPGGMTVPLTRATPLTPPVQTAFFGFARAPRPAKGDIGEPGKGAPQLAEIAARLAARGNRGGGGGDTPAPAPGREAARGAAPPARGTPPPARGATPQAGRGGRGPNFVFSVAADGLLRGIIPDTGDLAIAPARFLPANATATGLIWTDGFVYAATSNTCGGAPTAVFAMDYNAETKPVTRWESDGAAIAGVALGTDGTLYVSTGAGNSEHANAIVALEAKTLKVLQAYSTKTDPFITTPVVFTEGDRTFVAATTATSLHVLDAASFGGAGGADRAAGQRALQRRRRGHVARCRGHALAAHIGQRSEHRVHVRRQRRYRTLAQAARQPAHAHDRQRRRVRARERQHQRECCSVRARTGHREGTLDEWRDNHLDGQRRYVGWNRAGVRRDIG